MDLSIQIFSYAVLLHLWPKKQYKKKISTLAKIVPELNQKWNF